MPEPEKATQTATPQEGQPLSPEAALQAELDKYKKSLARHRKLLKKSQDDLAKSQEELAKCQKELKAQREQADIYERAEPELWIFRQKRNLANLLMAKGAEQWAAEEPTGQPWYRLYTELVTIRCKNVALAHWDKSFSGNILQAYRKLAATGDARKNFFMLALLLYHFPEELPVPLEIDAWPEALWDSLQAAWKRRSEEASRPFGSGKEPE